MTTASSQIKVLLIEDSTHDMEAVSRALSRDTETWEITHSSRAEDALEVLSNPENGFDIVVTDYNLPGINGLEFFKIALQRDLDIPFVILTGTGSEHIAADALKLGVTDYLIKDPLAGYLKLLSGTLINAISKFDIMRRVVQSEERFELAVEGSNDGLWDWDIKNDKTWWSPHFYELLGYEEGEIEANYQNFLDMLHPEDKDRTLAAIQSHLEQRTSYDIEHRLQEKSGEYRWFRARGQAVWNKQCKAIRMAGSTQDIAERKQAEAELEKHRHHLEELVQERTADMRAARDEAERANAAKSEFLSRMSHELRTPMNAILGFGQLLEYDAKDFTETQRENVQEILEAGHHLLDLINDVLDLAKIESGKLDITAEEVHVNDVLEQCMTLIGKQAQARHVKLIDQISDKGYTVQADFTRLKQVLLNLLTNAVKYNREHGRITLDSEIIDKQRLRIRVTDIGEGLTEANIAKLFRPFERLKSANNVEGTGIGLVISKHLIELMGGSIGVDSTPGEGSTFWVELALFKDV